MTGERKGCGKRRFFVVVIMVMMIIGENVDGTLPTLGSTQSSTKGPKNFHH